MRNKLQLVKSQPFGNVISTETVKANFTWEVIDSLMSGKATIIAHKLGILSRT